MTMQVLAPYGDRTNAELLAKIGKGQPKPGVSPRLAARMPRADLVAKVGLVPGDWASRGRRVIRRGSSV